MLVWNKEAPPLNIDHGRYKPFIKNDWFRKHYMWFAYGLMILLFNAAWFSGGFSAGSLLIKVLIYLIVFPVHEMLHIVTFFVPLGVAGYFRYVAWINAVTAGSDIINSFLILIKPGKTFFYRGYYRT